MTGEMIARAGEDLPEWWRIAWWATGIPLLLWAGAALLDLPAPQ